MSAAEVPTATAVRRLPVLALLGANAISLSGNAMTWVAVPWFAYSITGSAGQTGLIGAVTGLATVLAAFFGGPFVDRFGHRRTSILADLLSGASVLSIPVLHHTTGIDIWGLLALAFLGSFLDAPGSTARDALLPDAIAAARMRPERANAAYQGITYGAELIGPLLAGGLIAWVGASAVLAADAGTFAVSAIVVAVAVAGPPPDSGAEAVLSGARDYLGDLATGLRFLRGEPLLRAVATASVLTNFIGAPLFTVVMLVYVEGRYDSAAPLGLMIAAGAAGLVAGTLLYGAFGHRFPRRTTFIVGYSTWGLQMWVVLLGPPLWVIVLTFALRGILTAPYGPIAMTIQQERTPPDLRGRVFGTISSLSLGGLPLGFLIGGYMVERAGVSWTLAGMGAAYGLATVWLLLTPALRRMDLPFGI